MNKKTKIFAIVSGAIGIMIGIVTIAFFVIKFLWAWTIPDLFPGAVEQGLIAAEISWLTSFKLALFFGILSATSKANVKYKND
jgi:hypothetical protein